MIAILVRFEPRDEGAVRGFDVLANDTVAAVQASEPETLIYVVHKVCGGPFPSFLPIAASAGKEGGRTRCPRRGARDRNRHVWVHLKNKTNLFSDQLRVLHFVPERIFRKRLKKQPNLDYTHADVERPRAMVHADITQIPFADDSFDVILCSHVLEHVPEDRQAMRELCRVLKPDGWVLLLVPISSRRAETYEDATVIALEDRERLFGQFDRVRIYGRDFKTRLEEAGFIVRLEDLRHELEEERASEIRLARALAAPPPLRQVRCYSQTQPRR